MKSPFKIFLSSLFALPSFFSFSQTNLVPNFSFEIYDTCPSLEDQIQYAIGWSKYSVSITTPDYYNACAPSTGWSVPKSLASYQPERRNCNAYAGIFTWDANNYREHIGIQLSQPLIIGQKYFISFYTVMSEVFIAGNYYGMASDKIGLRLSTVAYNPSSPSPIDNFAHLYSSVIINDSISWIRVSGSIIADSTYNYIILGNFFDNANTDTLQYSCGTCFNSTSYYLIDDVCVSTDSLLCNGGIDTLPCITAINDFYDKYDIFIYPNPTTYLINIALKKNEDIEIELYDAFGKIIFSRHIINNPILEINMSYFPSGLYFLKIISPNNKPPVIKKIIKL